MTKAYDTWRERIASGTFTKAQCGQFATAVTRRHLGVAPHGRATNLTPEEATLLVHRLERQPVGLTPEHTAQGLAWLQRHGRKALGWSEAVRDDVLALFDRFTFDGAVELVGPYENSTLTVWTVHLTDGRELRYFNSAWQASYDGHADRAWWWV